MRTTVTLDADTAALVQEVMRREGFSFKEAINYGIRKGLSPSVKRKAFRQKVYDLGVNPQIPYDKTIALAGQLEDQEVLREISLGK